MASTKECDKLKASNQKLLSKLFRNVFLLSRREKDIIALNERIKKLKAIIDEYACDDDTIEKLRNRNHLLLARLFRISSDFNMLNKKQNDMSERLNK